MSTDAIIMPPPRTKSPPMQATLALHAEDLERIKQWIPETREEMRSQWQNISMS